MTPPPWTRVSRHAPCPVCGKPDWCLVATDGTAAICPRTESPKRCGDAGWLHRLAGDADRPRTRRFVIRPDVPTADLSELAGRYQRALAADRLAGLAGSLGLSVESLAALRVGWSADHRAYSFPMTGPATGRVVGIRLRAVDGSKFAVKGGREGLFLPTTPPAPTEPLFVAEGPTDAAALLDLGFTNVAGRPSCTSGTKPLVALVRTRKPPAVVVVADNDEPGTRGADTLASILALHGPDVRVIAPPPPFKDLRNWVTAGATRAAVEELIRSAARRQLHLRMTTRRTW